MLKFVAREYPGLASFIAVQIVAWEPKSSGTLSGRLQCFSYQEAEQSSVYILAHALQRRNGVAFAESDCRRSHDGIQVLYHDHASSNRLHIVHVHGWHFLLQIPSRFEDPEPSIFVQGGVLVYCNNWYYYTNC